MTDDKALASGQYATINNLKPTGTIMIAGSDTCDIYINTQPDGPQGQLLTIHPDGRVTFGPKFTTTDEASREFWHQLAKVFPLVINRPI